MKRLCSLGLGILFLALPLLPASAAGYGLEITGPTPYFGNTRGTLVSEGVTRQCMGLYELANLGSVLPGTEIFVPLSAKEFHWSGAGDETPWPEGKNRAIGDAFRKDLELELTVEAEEGKDLMDLVFRRLELAVRDGKTGVLIQFAPSYDYIEPMEFRLEAGIAVGGSVPEGMTFAVNGSLANRARRIAYRTNEPVALKPFEYYHSRYEWPQTVTLDLGGNVTATVTLDFEEAVYFRVSDAAGRADEVVMAAHPAITGVRRLCSDGVPGKRASISLGLGPSAKVYDGLPGLSGQGGPGPAPAGPVLHMRMTMEKTTNGFPWKAVCRSPCYFRRKLEN